MMDSKLIMDFSTYLKHRCREKTQGNRQVQREELNSFDNMVIHHQVKVTVDSAPGTIGTLSFEMLKCNQASF